MSEELDCRRFLARVFIFLAEESCVSWSYESWMVLSLSECEYFRAGVERESCRIELRSS